LRDGKYDVAPCFNYWTYCLKRPLPGKLRGIPEFLKMLACHNKRRDISVEAGQTFITDVDNCIECMRACPAGSHRKISDKNIRFSD